MKLLLLKWTTLGWQDLWDSLLSMGHEVSYIEYMPNTFEDDPVLEKYLMDRFTIEKFNAVMTFNYFQVISKVCNRFDIKYIAWVWDSPLLSLYSPTIHNPVNYVFIFDQVLFEAMKSKGVNTVYHLSLAVNAERLKKLEITQEDLNQYSSEISFVGRLYDNKLSYDSLVTLPPYYKGYLEGVMQAQTRIHGYNFLEEVLTDDIVEGIKGNAEFYLGDRFTGTLKKVIADIFLGVKVTQMERIDTLSHLSSYYPVDLYTSDTSKQIPNVTNKGFVDYYTQMPKVFQLSKINLNITHRTIQSGIPLRIFDIMGAGGFVLTNFQSELLDLFDVGKDLVIYESLEDLIEKARYYMEHEEERTRIAQCGCEKVREYHNYYVRLHEIFQIVFERP